MSLTLAALLIVALGAAVEGWTAIELGWRRALDLTDAPPDPALPQLVFAGPFRFVRHPQSLGLLLILAGLALAVRGAGMWLLALLAGALVVAMAVRHDRELARRWGEAYARYRRAVPLLLPWPRG
jgi:protein-S-isoprenylcysteine O-methyltransferase Ste14